MHLLIVDDEPIIRLGLVKMAEAYAPSFEGIRTAENGLDALEKINILEPDIILTDIRMPKMDGLALCQMIHSDYPHIQTAVISGHNDFEYAQKAMAYGVKHYLLKPLMKNDLHKMLSQLIQESTTGYFSVSRYIEWIDAMEQSIWSLQMEELTRLGDLWRRYCLSANLTLAKLKELLEDCSAMLVKRFHARGVLKDYVYEELQDSSAKSALDSFENRLRLMAFSLLAARKGNFKDPMEEAKAYIDSRLSEDISLDQVAAMIGLTPSYFSALFKRMTNETFVRYRINRRIEKAKELLSVPHIRIVDVAELVGYEDYPHFTKTFKKIVGISPSEFRNQMGIK
ncbi:response regulator transcription factor [Paenibacillus sp. UNC451MF]|uniref:response regulator transcription factor n=1 Tax=Paenibacillus sp. UNC451MF TaxID=1449063 RepID=UPI00048D01AC|nr:response regulator [Paenibacillus sp. UNC451MF]